jgi:cellobiose phosphorylase
MNEFSELCSLTGNDKLFKKYKKKCEYLKSGFIKYAWDGEWYWRATKDNGKKIGSRTNSEGKIYLNAQSWAVISGIADPDRAKQAIKSVTNMLLYKNGPLLLHPAYSTPDKMIGYLSRYAPGRRENGGVYTHAATWLIWAYALLKENKNVYETFRRLSPNYNGLEPEKYQAEPYVTPGNIDGPASPYYGMGGWTWYTGSASWFQKVITDWMLGIRATYKGLLIDPCIPEEWKEFSVKRTFRGTIYNIKICNENNVPSGVKQIIIDGKESSSNLLNIKGRNPVDVQVYMG